MVSIRRTVLVLLALVLGPRAGHSQTAAPARTEPWGLFSVRYDTRTSDFIYAVYGYGSSFAMVGALQNPRSDYTELLGAVGRNVSFDGATQSLAAGVARSADVWYGQMYFLPTLSAGPLTLRATSELDVPVSAGGLLQFALSPVSITVPVQRNVEVGLSTDLAAARDASTSIAVGPELRFTLPKAVLGADLQRMKIGQGSRARLFFLTQF